jgi:hypothetical protein
MELNNATHDGGRRGASPPRGGQGRGEGMHRQVVAQRRHRRPETTTLLRRGVSVGGRGPPPPPPPRPPPPPPTFAKQGRRLRSVVWRHHLLVVASPPPPRPCPPLGGLLHADHRRLLRGSIPLPCTCFSALLACRARSLAALCDHILSRGFFMRSVSTRTVMIAISRRRCRSTAVR